MGDQMEQDNIVKVKKCEMMFSIKGKLILVGALFIFTFIFLEALSTYSASKVITALEEMELRSEQVASLSELEVTLVGVTLAAMDAIVDKDSGFIEPDVQTGLNEGTKNIRGKLKELLDIADTGEEQRLAEGIIRDYPAFENLLLNDLPRIIRERAAEEVFAEMDNDIDSMAVVLDEKLMVIIESVQLENKEAIDGLRATLHGADYFRRTCLGLMTVFGSAFLFYLARCILLPLQSTIERVKDIAQGEGDLTKRLELGKDEIGELGGWLNEFIAKLQGIISDVKANLTVLDKSSSDLSDVAETLESGSGDANNRANTVSAAAEEMSSNMNAVAAASEQAAVNVNMVASATEEMNATVNEISGNTSKARQITEEAVETTERASLRVDELGSAANEISKVTEVITEISEQTNLLALNATIEAARAGEAGKGFAVVANEIKELAKQTSEATLEIKQKIEAIQSSTKLTVAEITQISSVISSVNEIVSTIATAVEEQSASTEEIASNVAQAAQGISEVNENVAQSSSVSGEIAEEITGVSRVAQEINANTVKVNQQSIELSNLSGVLSDLVGQFKV